jgi:hypothetical protein
MTMATTKKGGAFFPVFFLLISALFLSILGFAYYQTRLANPIMLDEQGHVK